MQPHASRSDSPSTGPASGIVTTSTSTATATSGKPLPSIPPIQTISPRSPLSNSPVSYSPSIKRKPLPLSALSPPPLPSPAFPHDQREGRTIAPPSSNTLNNILETTPQEHVEDESYVDDPHSYSFLESPTDTKCRVSFDDFPIPLSQVTQPPPTQPPPTLSVADEEPTSLPEEKGMGLRLGERPPPLRMDSISSVKSMDPKKPQSPGNKFTSFFMRKPQASPGVDSAVTEISDGRSPMPSPYPQSDTGSANFGTNSYFNFGLGRTNTAGSQDSIDYPPPSQPKRTSSDARCTMLEAELKEISIELANSIRRELDLEDIVERLQSDNPHPISADRTSDYFSDSGTSSLRADGSELTAKEELDKVKRESEQNRAQLKVNLSHRWQEEVIQRKALETAFDHLRRKLYEEKKAKENFEDLLQALRAELEQHRVQKDQLSNDVVPKLQQEVQHLKDENAALVSAREMERNINRGSMHFIAEEDDLPAGRRGSMATPRIGGLSRSNTITNGRTNRGSLARSGSLSRNNSVLTRPAQTVDVENAAEKIQSIEQQRDALHNTVKYLLKRQEVHRHQSIKRTRMLEAELDRAQNTAPQPRKGGYEREVRVLRSEINTLRKRADDALDQKWQCEKNLAGLKMDLDRNKQETASLQKILQAKGSDPDVQGLMSATLENAIVEMQQERARIQESSAQIQQEEHLAEQIEEYAIRSQALSTQVNKQLQNNAALRSRLKAAVESGEHNQQASAHQIIELQSKLRNLEDSISGAQITSETAVMKHEEEIRVLKASHNAQLMRALSGNKKTPSTLATPTAKSPLSPMFANSKKSPKLDNTSSGPGMALHEALRTEYLENKVTDLERALAETENEIGKIVGKMNQAQMNVAELEAERDEALRLTRQLETQVIDERARYADLIATLNQW